MPSKMKLDLNELNIESFVTENNKRVLGGEIPTIPSRCERTVDDWDCITYKSTKPTYALSCFREQCM